jgi:hypothetical protein
MESAREVFDKCCIEIAASLEQTGFQYRPSKHSAIRASGDLKFEIHFQSSRRNFLVPDGGVDDLKRRLSKLMPFGDFATFGNVTLITHAEIRSEILRNFRKSLPSSWRADDAVTGSQVGNLQTPAKWMQFNLANPYTRVKVIAEASQLINTVALPYFDLFKNPACVVARLLDGSMPWTWEPSALEYVCCFGSMDQALQLLNKFTNESPSRAAEFCEVLHRYKTDGIPEVWDSGAPARLAKAAIILGLDNRVPPR